jgi:arylsulfatase A-like enzyme
MSPPAAIPPIDGVDTVVLLSADSLRLDRLHGERDGTPLMPNAAAFGDRALEFEEGIAPAIGTNNSVPAMLTGAYPSQFRGYSLPPAGTGPSTLAEHLEEADFSTAAFHQNNVVSRRYNFDRGFDTYYDVSTEAREEGGGAAWRLAVRNRIGGTPLMDLANWLQFRVMETFGRSLYELSERGDSLTDRAIEWLDATGGKRFLWLHYMDTHHPYVSSDRVQQMFGADISKAELLQLSREARTAPGELTDEEVERLRLQYDCAVRFVDEQIGRVLDHLEAEGDLSNAMVVVTSDHGEEFLEHGKIGHRTSLWDELLRVPLLAWHPEVGDRSVDGQGPLRSLVDTVVDGTGWFEMLDSGAEYVVSENDREGVWTRSCRGNGYKGIDEVDERIYTECGGGEERAVLESAVPEDVLSDLSERLSESHEQFETGAVDEEALRDDLEALGYLE